MLGWEAEHTHTHTHTNPHMYTHTHTHTGAILVRAETGRRHIQVANDNAKHTCTHVGTFLRMDNLK